MKLAIVGIVVAGLAALALRVVIEGRSALADGDVALAEKRPADAIAAWESAARWYLPGAPHVDDAYARLVAYARAHASLAAWRSVRGAALATRSLWTPHADDLDEANAAIAQLAADDPEGAPSAPAERGLRVAWHAGLLAGDARPSKGAAALAIAGIVAWLVGIALVIRRGIGARGELVRRRAVVGAAVAVGGILVWAAGLYSA